MKNIVSQKWLVENMSNKELIILDVRNMLGNSTYGIEEYNKGHIRGAQFVSVEGVLTGEVKEHGGRHPLPHMEEFIEDMKKLGISDESLVVIYDNGELSMAGRLYWMLKYIGKMDVYILEGGLNKWKENNLELSTDATKKERSDSLSLNIDHSMVVDMEHVKKSINNPKSVLIDSREYERYSGQKEPIDKIPGHIPSALNLPWIDLIKNGKLLTIEELEERYKDLDKYDELIVHCGSGITATVNIIFMEEIGLKPKLYLGSYSDWISYDNNEIVTN